MRSFWILALLAAALTFVGCDRQPVFDVVLRNGSLCDGSGAPCTPGGVAINGDTIAKTGDVSADKGRVDIDVHNLLRSGDLACRRISTLPQCVVHGAFPLGVPGDRFYRLFRSRLIIGAYKNECNKTICSRDICTQIDKF